MLGPDSGGSSDTTAQLEIARINADRDVAIERAREDGRTARTRLRETGKTARSRLRNWGTAIIIAGLILTSAVTGAIPGAAVLGFVERALT